MLIGAFTPPLGTGSGVGLVAAGAVTTLVELESPSFVAAHPTRPVAYAVLEREVGGLATFGPDGSVLDQRPSGGAHPCHVAVSPDGQWIAVAHYGDGSAVLFACDEYGIPRQSVRLEHVGSGPVVDRQQSAHVHQIVFVGDLLLAVDLGGDAVHRYRLTAGHWLPAAGGSALMPPGSGPRHLVAAGSRRWVVGELDATITAFDEEPSGRWRQLARTGTTSTTGDTPAYPSHLALYDGHLYVANRGPGTLAVLRADDTLAVVGEVPTGGAWPRHFAIADDAVVVANERSDELTWLPLGHGPVPLTPGRRMPVASPTCVAVAGW